jgi:hypothetical protein
MVKATAALTTRRIERSFSKNGGLIARAALCRHRHFPRYAAIEFGEAGSRHPDVISFT